MNIHRNQNEIEQYAGMNGSQNGAGIHDVGHTHGSRTNGAANHAGRTNAQGYSVDFSGNLFGDQAYESQGRTMEDVMAEAEMTDAALQKDYMTVMSHTMSDEDFAKLSEDGFEPGRMEPEEAVTIVDKIKTELAKAGVMVTGYNDDIDVETLEKITGSKARAQAIMEAFQQYDIPVTEENAQAANSAMDMVEQITKQLQKDMETGAQGEAYGIKKYLLENHLQATIGNLYRAAYSGSHDAGMQGRGYFAETTGGYYGKKADGADVVSLQESLEKVIKDAGCEVSEKTMQDAEWMVASGLPLTAETFTELQTIDRVICSIVEGEEITDASTGVSSAEVMAAKSVARAIQAGQTAKAADLSGQESMLEKAVRINDEVQSISDEAVDKVIEEGEKLDIVHLIAAEKEMLAGTDNDEKIQQQKTPRTDMENHPAAEDQSISASQGNTAERTESDSRMIAARRQMEEIRLSMSVQVNYHMLKQGISIDTTELSDLVEHLKEAEQAIGRILFGGASDHAGSSEDNEAGGNMAGMEHIGMSSEKEMSALFQEAVGKVRAIPGMPASILGELLQEHGTSFSQSVTVDMVYETGTARQNAYAAMEERYEPLMTAPMAEYGDSIRKAFRNVDDILQEMNLDSTESNQRAVRILGYNSMEISESNIYAVKEAYAEVSRVIDKMTPAATLDMIREGKNPLNMSMEELENYLSERDSDPQKEMEKYSRYLYHLEQKHEITEEEKESYIGIYRLLHQIEKRDGAAIGSLLQQGAEINFRNLLTAVRSYEHGRMDYNIDDGFGALKEEMGSYRNSISEAIERGYGSEPEEKEAGIAYYRKLAGDIKAELTPESVSELFNKDDMSLEEFFDRQKSVYGKNGSDAKISGVRGDNTGVTEEAAEIASREDAYRKEQAADLRKTAEVSEQAVEMMLSFDLPHTLDNMAAAETMLYDRGSMARQVREQAAYLDDISFEGKDHTEVNGGQSADMTDKAVPTADHALKSDETAFCGMLKKAMTDVQEHFTDSVSALEAYEQLADCMENILAAGAEQQTERISIKDINLAFKQVSLARNMAREESYEIPMEIGGRMTSVNVRLRHSNTTAANVAITMETEQYGKVSALFEGEDLSGYIICDREEGLAALKKQEDAFKEQMQSKELPVSEIKFVYSDRADINILAKKADDINSTGKSSTDLYETAKAFMKAFLTA